jgi:hypothetical protein
VRDERDDFSTFDGVCSDALTPRPTHKSRTAVEVAATPTTKKGGKNKKQQFSTMKRIQGRVPIIPPPSISISSSYGFDRAQMYAENKNLNSL